MWGCVCQCGIGCGGAGAGFELFLGLVCLPLMLTAGFIGSFPFSPRQHAPLTSTLAIQSVCSTLSVLCLFLPLLPHSSSFSIVLLSVWLALVTSYTSLRNRSATPPCKVGCSSHQLVVISLFFSPHLCVCHCILLL